MKAYSTVSHGLHTFRHWSRGSEVRSLGQLKVHNGIFLNECRLLLRLVEDEQTADEMLEDEVNQRWLSKDLNDKFNSALEQNVDLCRSIIEETRNIVDDMEEQLKQFDTLKKQKQKVRAPLAGLLEERSHNPRTRKLRQQYNDFAEPSRSLSTNQNSKNA